MGAIGFFAKGAEKNENISLAENFQRCQRRDKNNIMLPVNPIVSTENKPPRVTDVYTALEMLESVMTYFTEAGITVEVANDARNPDLPKLVLRIPNCLAFRDENGKHIFRPFVSPNMEDAA